MSEKRFIIVESIENLYALVDKEREDKEQILIFSLHKEQLGVVCDVLNELSDEIGQLKEENKQLKKSEKINMEYAEQIVEENHKFRIAKNDLRRENERLRKSVEYWQKKFEEGTETFISENDDIHPFKFNSNQAQPYTIKNVSLNGVVRLGNGHKAQWRMKDVREISQELPPFEEFNREIFHEIRNKLGAKFDKDVIGRIIYNIYIGTFGEYI